MMHCIKLSTYNLHNKTLPLFLVAIFESKKPSSMSMVTMTTVITPQHSLQATFNGRTNTAFLPSVVGWLVYTYALDSI